jgi:hypothetical protein
MCVGEVGGSRRASWRDMARPDEIRGAHDEQGANTGDWGSRGADMLGLHSNERGREQAAGMCVGKGAGQNQVDGSVTGLARYEKTIRF